MVELVQGSNALDAWRNGASVLLSQKEVYNLVTVVRNPLQLEAVWFDEYDLSNHTDGKVETLSYVADTIFPRRYLDKEHSRHKIYKIYLRAYDSARRRGGRRGHWGTYFQRLLRFGKSDEQSINQLEIAISKLKNWGKNHKAALVMHTSSANLDGPRTRGGPCLQYIALQCPNKNTVSLLAVYRNHNFFTKALGNFIGLGQLLKFICRETNRNSGELVCHSGRAFYDSVTQEGFKSYAQL